jgi:hypothetical protein
MSKKGVDKMYAGLRKCYKILKNQEWEDENELYPIAKMVHNTQTEGEDPNFVLWVREMEDMLNDIGWTKRKVRSIQLNNEKKFFKRFEGE